MKQFWLLIALAVFSTSLFASGVQSQSDTIDVIKPGIVAIGTLLPTRRPPVKFLGTGFAVSDGLHVVSNLHVMPESLAFARNESLVVLVGQDGMPPDIRFAEKVEVDYAHDLVLLKINGAPLRALKIGESSVVREGDEFLFTGFPIGGVLGLYPVTHKGMVSAITPIVIPQDAASSLNPALIGRLRSPYNVFQLDATAYPGNSGSPLYSFLTGEVVGIVNMVFVKGGKESVLTSPSGISYAIPSSYVIDLLEKYSFSD